MKIEMIGTLAGLVWALSFFLCLGTVQPLDIERLAAVAVCFFSLAPLIFCGVPLHQRRMTAPLTGMLVVLFWLLVIISSAWSVAPPVSLIYGVIFSVLPATVLSVMIADPAIRTCFLRWAAWGTGVVVTGLGGWALIQIFLLPEMLVNGQVRDPFSNPNVLAGLLSLSFFTGLALYLCENKKIARKVLPAALFIILCALIAMGGKAASIIFGLGLIAFAVLRGRSIEALHRNVLAVMIAGAALVEMIIMSLPNRASLARQMTNMADGDLISTHARLDIWRATMGLIAQHPVLGTGYRSFYLMYPSIRLPSEAYSSGLMAHNDPLQFWSEIGIFGPVLFYAIGAAIVFRFARHWRRKKEASVLALFIGCAGFILHSHVDFLLYAMPTMMAFGLAFAMLVTECGDQSETIPFSFTASWPQGAAGMAAVLPVLALMALYTPLMLGEYETNRADKLLKTGDVKGFGEAINAANHVGDGMNDRPYVMAVRVPLGILQVRAPTIAREEQTQLFHQIETLLAKAEQRNSRRETIWYIRGLMLQKIDPSIAPKDYPDQEACFTKALAINKLHLPSRLALADMYDAKGEKEKELEILKEGLYWPYTSFDTRAYYARTENLAKALNRGDIADMVARYRAAEENLVQASIKRANSMAKAGLSTGN